MNTNRIRLLAAIFALSLLLTACSGKDRQAIDAVEEAIAAIDLNELDEFSIKNARSLYDALDDDLKEKVETYSTLTNAEQALQQKQELESLLKEIHIELYNNIDACNSLRDAITETWKTAIDMDSSFNEALSALFMGESYYKGLFSHSASDEVVSQELASYFVECMDLTIDHQSYLEGLMKDLGKLDVDDKVYNPLFDLYSKYVMLYNQVTSPSGSYKSYTESTNSTIDQIQQAESLLDIAWPYD